MVKIDLTTPNMSAPALYVPPWKAKQLAEAANESATASSKKVAAATSFAAQQASWAALKKSLNGVINRASAPNIKPTVAALFRVNLIRGRGVFAKAIMSAQAASPGFSNVYAAMVAVVNTKLPENGELIVTRVSTKCSSV